MLVKNEDTREKKHWIIKSCSNILNIERKNPIIIKKYFVLTAFETIGKALIYGSNIYISVYIKQQ